MMLSTLGLAACLALAQTPATAAEGSSRDHADQASHVSRAFLASPTTSVNGRPFIGRDGSAKATSPTVNDDAARHGAGPDAPATIVVSVPGLFGFEQEPRRFEIDPFKPVEVRRGDNRWSDPYVRSQQKLAARVEEARRTWLADNNYTGGIRTFKSPAAERKVADASVPPTRDTRRIEPRAVFELPADMPRLRSKIRVMGKDESPVRRADARVRVVTPAAEQKVAGRQATATPTKG